MRVGLSRSTEEKARTLPVWLPYVSIGVGLILLWQLYVSLSGASASTGGHHQPHR